MPFIDLYFLLGSLHPAFVRALVKPVNMPPELRHLKAPAPAEGVRIRVSHVGLCRTDLYVAEGLIPVEAPIVLSHEFSGIVAGEFGQFHAGDRVVVNPLYGNRFMGVDFDGALCDEIVVPEEQVYRLPDSLGLREAAYLEPVAASMAVLKASISPDQRGAVYGINRIAELTRIILETAGFAGIETMRAKVENQYDFIIETMISDETLPLILRALRPGGLLVIKSRNYKSVQFPVNLMVAREVRLECVQYAPFDEALQWLARNTERIAHLLGDTYPLDRFQEAFASARGSESRKTFISLD